MKSLNAEHSATTANCTPALYCTGVLYKLQTVRVSIYLPLARSCCSLASLASRLSLIAFSRVWTSNSIAVKRSVIGMSDTTVIWTHNTHLPRLCTYLTWVCKTHLDVDAAYFSMYQRTQTSICVKKLQRDILTLVQIAIENASSKQDISRSLKQDIQVVRM